MDKKLARIAELMAEIKAYGNLQMEIERYRDDNLYSDLIPETRKVANEKLELIERLLQGCVSSK